MIDRPDTEVPFLRTVTSALNWLAVLTNRAAARVLEKNSFTFVEARTVLLAYGQKKECAFYLRCA